MSWLFGKKKPQKDLPLESTEEDHDTEQGNGFVLVENCPAPGPMNAATYPTGSMYPYVPPVPEYSTTIPTDPTKDHNSGDSTHYLCGVPFKLSKHLEISMSNDLEIDRLRIDEILLFIDRIQKQNYDYSFSLEQGIVTEMNSRSDE